jgi:hypothetical protein
MPTHDVYGNLPFALLGKKDAVFEIYEDGKKLGTITMSKGSIEWYPKNAKLPYSFSWSEFDKMIKDSK